MRAASYAAPSGTVTRVVTEGFGAKGGDPAATEFELRASWSPARPDGDYEQPNERPAEQASFAGHVAAWCDALCAAAGLSPLEDGVRALPRAAARQRGASTRVRTRARHHEGPPVR